MLNSAGSLTGWAQKWRQHLVRENCEKKLFISFCYIMVGLLIILICWENFLFASRLGLVGIREIDDLAFQEVLRKIHITLNRGEISKLFTVNDYAYGWIFWLPMALITYPAFLLSKYFQFDWLLIIIPRFISLTCGVLSLVYLRKLLKKFDVPEWGCAAGILIFFLFPTIGFFSQRFGTVNIVMFFSLLSFYFALNCSTSTNLGSLAPVLSLAITGAIKLSGLLIAPLIFAIGAYRLQEKRISPLIKKVTSPLLVFFCCLIIFSNPSLLTWPYHKAVGLDYWNTMKHFIDVTKLETGPSSPFERFYLGVFGTLLNGMAVLLVSAGFLAFWKKDKEARFYILAILISVAIVIVYLLLSVKNVSGTGSYFTSVSFLLMFGVVGWARTSRGFHILSFSILLLLADTTLRAREQWMSPNADAYPWNHFSYLIKDHKIKPLLSNAYFIGDCTQVSSDNTWAGHLFVDFTIPLPFNSLSHPQACFSISWNNLSPMTKYCDRPVDFIILDKSAPGELPKNDFEQRLLATDSKVRENLLQDRASRVGLRENGTFGKEKFFLLCENDQVKVYEAK